MESLVSSGQVADFGRVQVGQDECHAALGYIPQLRLHRRAVPIKIRRCPGEIGTHKSQKITKKTLVKSPVFEKEQTLGSSEIPRKEKASSFMRIRQHPERFASFRAWALTWKRGFSGRRRLKIRARRFHSFLIRLWLRGDPRCEQGTLSRKWRRRRKDGKDLPFDFF